MEWALQEGACREVVCWSGGLPEDDCMEVVCWSGGLPEVNCTEIVGWNGGLQEGVWKKVVCWNGVSRKVSAGRSSVGVVAIREAVCREVYVGVGYPGRCLQRGHLLEWWSLGRCLQGCLLEAGLQDGVCREVVCLNGGFPVRCLQGGCL